MTLIPALYSHSSSEPPSGSLESWALDSKNRPAFPGLHYAQVLGLVRKRRRADARWRSGRARIFMNGATKVRGKEEKRDVVAGISVLGTVTLLLKSPAARLNARRDNARERVGGLLGRERHTMIIIVSLASRAENFHGQWCRLFVRSAPSGTYRWALRPPRKREGAVWKIGASTDFRGWIWYSGFGPGSDLLLETNDTALIKSCAASLLIFGKLYFISDDLLSKVSNF